MQVLVDADYLELLRNDDDGKSKQDNTEIDPFTGKRCKVVSMEEVKKLVSLPKEKRQKMIQGIFVRYI